MNKKIIFFLNVLNFLNIEPSLIISNENSLNRQSETIQKQDKNIYKAAAIDQCVKLNDNNSQDIPIASIMSITQQTHKSEKKNIVDTTCNCCWGCCFFKFFINQMKKCCCSEKAEETDDDSNDIFSTAGKYINSNDIK